MACHVSGQRPIILEFDDIPSHATLKEIVDQSFATKVTNGCPYSSLRTVIGSTRTARWAGIALATAATTPSKTAVAPGGESRLREYAGDAPLAGAGSREPCNVGRKS